MPTPGVPVATMVSVPVTRSGASYYRLNLRFSPKVGSMPFRTAAHAARRAEGSS